MPNHCANQLTITGPAEDRKRFALHACSDESKLDLQQFVPMPEELSGTRSVSPRQPHRRNAHAARRAVRTRQLVRLAYSELETKWTCYYVNFDDDGSKLVYTFKNRLVPLR